jgi:hypothetical protein
VSAKWIRIYAPGAFRRRDGWYGGGKDMYVTPPAQNVVMLDRKTA